MNCPFLTLRERTVANVSRIRHASRGGVLGRIIGLRLFAEYVLVCCCW